MDKKNRWRLLLIAAVLALSIHQILPTIFFYAKPLKNPVSQEKIASIETQIKERLDQLEKNVASWVLSFCDLIHVKPSSFDTTNSAKFVLQFAKSEDAEKFKTYFPQAASFFPHQGEVLTLGVNTDNPKELYVQRAISCRLNNSHTPLFETVNVGSERYQKLIDEKKEAIFEAIKREPLDLKPIFSLAFPSKVHVLCNICKAIEEIQEIAKENPELASQIAYPIRATNQSDLFDLLSKTHEELLKEIENIPADARKNIEEKEQQFASAIQILKKKNNHFSEIKPDVTKSFSAFIRSISTDLVKNEFVLEVDPSVKVNSKKIESLLMEEFARISYATQEELVACKEGYRIPIFSKKGLSSLLLFQLGSIEDALFQETLNTIQTEWMPKHPDFSRAKVVDEKAFSSLSIDEKALCLVLSKTAQNSIRLEIKGIEPLIFSYEKKSETEIAKLFFDDLTKLSQLLSSKNFRPARSIQGICFEKSTPFFPLLQATREKWKLIPNRSLAILELSSLEDRINEENRIDTEIHEELLRWEDEYKAAQVSLDPNIKLTVPKPTQNPLWSNFRLFVKKMIRGDEKRVLKWGLDLSGGKSIQLELCDQNGKTVTDDFAIKQGINELFERVNRLGVSDVSIRQIGHHIALDFPGSDGMSAADLVKASSMSFHLVNEQFGPLNPSLAETTDRFLKGVWNEAISTRKTDPENIALIASKHLYESPLEDAIKLQKEGLSLGLTQDSSKVVLMREMNGHHHPLMIVFKEPVLLGSSLCNIHSSYDSTKGNFLSFEIQGSDAQQKLHDWTSKYSKEGVVGTPLDFSGRGKGWRMAVVLNGTVISAPSLESALSNSASISGSFSQREVQKFASDLKAGSLTFSPKILVETAISPELGTKERAQGIQASFIALSLVILAMVFYYRFAGVVASCAVLCNLLILWAVLQNMGASLSLAGIAGIILTIGMAVDANVLVFERMKEEFAKTGNVRSAIFAGFDKAFSAILDSNLTTILAALVLLQFDSGPIRAFAVTMIVGIASSMFTALFMTRTYFTYWAKRKDLKPFSMANWFKNPNFHFLKWTRAAVFLATIVSIIGIGSLLTSKNSILSLDFTGGYALRLDLDTTKNPAHIIENALIAAGANTNDFQVREIQHSTGVELFLGSSFEEPGKPFANLQENGSKIDWIRSAIENAGAHITQSFDELQSAWSTMSGQMSQTMRNQALVGLCIALGAIFIYLIFRFEMRYALSALLCLLHDLIVTIAILGVLKLLGVAVQIDLTVVAALMTIVGYSLNDTIIVFDRIRENLKLHTKMSLFQIIQTSLNETLSRTAMTSGTTLLVVIALLFFGGSSIFSFSLVMTVGVIVGTLSSWFIACPLLLTLSQESKFR